MARGRRIAKRNKNKPIPHTPIQHTEEALLVHRELAFLRAGAWAPHNEAQRKRKERWMNERTRKLEHARRAQKILDK